MKRYYLFFVLLVSVTTFTWSQNVGIGTITPVSKLTVQTPLNTTGFTHIGGVNEIIVNDAIGGVSASFGTATNHAFRIKSNDIGRLHIYPGGEVVVGDNSFGPIGRFTVGTAPGNVGLTHSDGTITLSTFTGGTQPFAYIGTQSNHALSFYTNNSQSQAILLPNGNFGIGTNAPTAKLYVEGTARFTGDTRIDGFGDFLGTVGIGTLASSGTGLTIAKDNEAIRIRGNQSYITFFNGLNYKGYLWNKGADDMELGTAGVNANGKLFLSIKGTPYVSLHSNGRVSINGPSATWLPLNSNLALTVSNTIVLKDYANNFNEWAMVSNHEDLRFYFNSLGKSYIDINGDYNTLSDQRLKESFKPYKNVLQGIKKLNVLTYHYKSNEAGKNSFGLIAQNVAEYFPELVSETKDKDGKKLLGVSYGKTGVLAIKAIQEQQEIIEQQQSKIELLEKRFAALEKLLMKN